MLRDVIKIALYLLGVYLLVTVQLSFLQSLSYPWSQISLIIAAVYLVGLVWNYQLGLLTAGWAGFLLELYSPLTPGAILGPLILSLLIINFLFNLLFTNRSIYSVIILTLVGGVFYHLSQGLYQFIGSSAGWNYRYLEISRYFLQAMIWQIVLTTLIVAVIFLIFYRFSRVTRSNFLLSSRR